VRISRFSDLPVSALIGAVVTTADGCELGVVVDVRLMLSPHKVIIWIRQDGNGVNGIDWGDLEGATLSLQSPHS
jgi:sporulation protein YlmC with PRC-barrel domain